MFFRPNVYLIDESELSVEQVRFNQKKLWELSKQDDLSNVKEEEIQSYIKTIISPHLKTYWWQKIFKDNAKMLQLFISNDENQNLVKFLFRYPPQLHDISLHSELHFEIVKKLVENNTHFAPPRLRILLKKDEATGVNLTQGMYRLPF